MAAGPQQIVTDELDRLAGQMPALGVAVSGGGDSMALLHVAADWARARGVRIEAASVDHGLRPGSAAEAAAVGRAAAALGLPHAVLRWRHGGAPQGNLMDAARRARMGLLADWARGRGLAAVALGHTQDDVAETLLMRLARGAGLDGLAAMADAREQGGMMWLRPMLGVRRAALRDWLTARGIGWADDPSNDNPDFERVRARQAIAALDLPVAALARSAAALAEARVALAEAAVAAATGVSADRGMLRLPRAALDASPEIRRRLVVAALRWITRADYPPRGADVGRLVATLLAGGQGTLQGVIARVRGETIEILREPSAAARAAQACGAETRDVPRDEIEWDRRWRLGGLPAGATVHAATAADLAGLDWRAAGLPRLALLSSPAVRTGARVVVPLVQSGAGIVAKPLRDAADYLAILRAH